MFGGIFGGNSHAHVPKPDFKALAKNCVFKEGELKGLFKRYCGLCDHDGLVREQALYHLEEFVINPMIMWFVSYEIEQSPAKGLSFEAMVGIFSTMSPLADNVHKVHSLLKTISVQEGEIGSGVSGQLFADLFVHLNSGLAPSEEVRQLGVDIWAAVERESPGADAGRMLSHLISKYDLWNVLTAELVW